MQIEELLDAYGANNNRHWHSFRAFIAAIKLFSDAGYELLHIQHAIPSYRLLPIEQDFRRATDQALVFIGEVLRQTANKMIAHCLELKLPVPQKTPCDEDYVEPLPAGRLPRDCDTRTTETVEETVTLLATAFLNLAAESQQVHTASDAKPEEYDSYLKESLSEESLRNIQLRFHNLQSLYDTYVSGTETENLDQDLPILRGHISVVFHLLKTATLFAHYYERHLMCQKPASSQDNDALVNSDALLAILMNYSINYISDYIGCAERLCQSMLKRYAKIGEIEVNVPRYRGFHVRPSTLISKLVLHYGSNVQMKLEGEVYDASSPLEIFRANEKINAEKRRWLATEIYRLRLTKEDIDEGDLRPTIRNIISKLYNQGKLVLYEQPLKLPEELEKKGGILLEQVTSEIARLQVTGKIDIHTDLMVKFIGDTRVLEDIKLLVESGYGEDNFGNNVPLPDKLAYLRR
jgi:hypothetical protein